MTKKPTNSTSILSKEFFKKEPSDRRDLRLRIQKEAGISRPQFYYILRVGRTDKLKQEVFARAFAKPVEELFSDN